MPVSEKERKPFDINTFFSEKHEPAILMLLDYIKNNKNYWIPGRKLADLNPFEKDLVNYDITRKMIKFGSIKYGVPIQTSNYGYKMINSENELFEFIERLEKQIKGYNDRIELAINTFSEHNNSLISEETNATI
jgi:hypothetical protein